MRTTIPLCALTAGLACLLTGARAFPAEVKVADAAELRAAVAQAAPGSTILIAPGNYPGGLFLTRLAGTAKEPIVIKGADPDKPPVFSGGNEGLHLVDCVYVTLANITVKGAKDNGINIDDGGSFDTPTHHITLENVSVLEIGPKGNHDAMKLSGLDDFVIRKCRVEGWGGSAIDMVGCHRGLVEDCTFTGKDGFSQDSGIQMKGGSCDILVQTSFFDRAGDRPVNLGGSTGLAFFRPKVDDYEAKDLTVAGNRFVGGEAVAAFVTAQNCRVHHNTIYLPEKWVLRILQESADTRFKPCQGGRFESNLVVFDRKLGPAVNVGAGTEPKSFVFKGNAWFQVDGAQKVDLPAPEEAGVYGVDPQLVDAGKATMRVGSKDERLKGVGADAYEKPAKQ